MTVKLAVFVAPFAPVIVTEVLRVTVLVVTANVTVVLPDVTVTLEGTVTTEVLLLDSVTVAPLEGDGPLSVTVPVEFCDPPFTVVGFRVSELRVGALTVSVAERATPSVPVILTEVLDATGLVVMVKVAVVAFAATVTLAGTCAAVVLLLDRVTTAPFAGAGPFSVTVAVEVFPPITDVGLRTSELRVAALTVNVAVLVTP